MMFWYNSSFNDVDEGDENTHASNGKIKFDARSNPFSIPWDVKFDVYFCVSRTSPLVHMFLLGGRMARLGEI